MKKGILITAALSALIALTLTSCKQLDVIGNTSVSSFDAVLKAVPDKVSEDVANDFWTVNAPDGGARFLWSRDFSKTGSDVRLIVDARAFINAGLDISKLPAGMVQGGELTFGQDLGRESGTKSNDDTPLGSFTMIEEMHRETIKYHSALDHFGVDVGDGNAFEFAKDMNANDKDIVFVLNPQLLIDAGVDPAKVDGWIFAKVSTMESSGRKIQVDKFLKPFNLK